MSKSESLESDIFAGFVLFHFPLGEFGGVSFPLGFKSKIQSRIRTVFQSISAKIVVR